MTKSINAALFSQAIVSGAHKLSNNREYVDSLNIFPVPDGDTGTNMSLTFINAARAVENETLNSVGEVSAAVAKATLRGARGNSGVILSQIFRGISKELTNAKELDVTNLKLALRKGSDTAYRAVMKPTEGTILTVIRSLAEAGEACEKEDIEEFFEEVLSGGKLALKKTQEMLPQLKAAGVVDAGGQGLIYIFEGFFEALKGNVCPLEGESPVTPSATQSAQSTIKTEDIKFAYCTEFIINKFKPEITAAKMRAAIEPKGDCMIVIDDDDIVKVHIHTNNPGFVLEQAIKIGELVNIKIENMKEQHSNILKAEETVQNKERVSLAVVSVVNGAGLENTFKELGASYLIHGGQTMNPSTEDILSAINSVNADNVIILPNNKNIILAAEQAAQIAECNAIVIGSKTVPQGIAAMMEFSPHSDVEVNTKKMTSALSNIKSGSVTHAVKTTDIDGKHIEEGDIIGVSDGHILSVDKEINASSLKLINEIADEYSEIITLYFGEGITEDEANALGEELEDLFPDADVYVSDGGQSVYYYLISVE